VVAEYAKCKSSEYQTLPENFNFTERVEEVSLKCSEKLKSQMNGYRKASPFLLITADAKGGLWLGYSFMYEANFNHLLPALIRTDIL
jgi:hypothetical protein